MVLLGDQPGVEPGAIDAVIAAFRSGAGPVIQAAYSGRPAHPTLMARTVWAPLLAEIGGDEGARSALTRHPEWRSTVELGGEPPDDVDTEMDYERARGRFE